MFNNSKSVLQDQIFYKIIQALYCPFVDCREEIKGSDDLENHITIHTGNNFES